MGFLSWPRFPIPNKLVVVQKSQRALAQSVVVFVVVVEIIIVRKINHQERIIQQTVEEVVEVPVPMAQEEIMHVPMVANHHRHHHVEFVLVVVIVVVAFCRCRCR